GLYQSGEVAQNYRGLSPGDAALPVEPVLRVAGEHAGAVPAVDDLAVLVALGQIGDEAVGHLVHAAADPGRIGGLVPDGGHLKAGGVLVDALQIAVLLGDDPVLQAVGVIGHVPGLPL